MNKDQSFFLFSVFNIIFGLCGIGLIVSSIIMIFAMNFSSIPFIMISLGLLMILIMILGLKSQKKLPFIIVYLVFIMIIFLFFGVLSGLFIAFKENLINYFENILNVNDFDFDNIYKYNLNLFIVSLIAAFIGLLTFITGVIYCKKLKKSKYYKAKGKEEEEDILKGLDYSIPIESGTKD